MRTKGFVTPRDAWRLIFCLTEMVSASLYFCSNACHLHMGVENLQSAKCENVNCLTEVTGFAESLGHFFIFFF